MASRNEIEIVLKADDKASGVIDGFLGRISGAGQSMMRAGAAMTAAAAPIGLALGMAVTSAVAFDASMTNVGAVMGKSRTEMAALNKEVLRIGANSRAGPQMAADAFYDIVGGVSDASAHMAILQASINTAEAGSAELGSTTTALIAVMNSYKFGAEDAAYASDVLTRTVGMGVGTMSDFASALPSITGLAKSLDISFGDLAASTAYLTTQGNTASQATTQLSAMMTAMLNPNENMKKAIQELGFANGAAAVEQLGLVGAMNALKETNVANTSGMAAMLGSTEALRGVTALAGPEFAKFAKDFTDGITGATAAAQGIQLDSPAAQMDLFKSKMSALGITIGTILLPPLIDLSGKIMPIVDSVLAWAQANPQAMTTIVGIAGAAIAAGPIVGLLGAAITGVTTAVGILLSPAFLLAGAIAAIVAAAEIGYPGGVVQLFRDATTTAQQLAFLGLYVLNTAAQGVRSAIEAVITKAKELWDGFNNLYTQSPEVRNAFNTVAAAALIVAATILTVKIGYAAAAVVQGALATGAWALAAAKTALAGAAMAASGGMAAFAASAAAAVAPLALIATAILGIVLAVKNFNDVTAQVRQTTGTQVAEMSASGQLTEQQLWEQAHRSAESQFGAGTIAADVAARAIFNDLRQNMVSGARAMGGPVIGGRSYLIGERGPEIWTAPASGNITSNSDMQQMAASGAGAGGGGITFSGPITVHANSEEEGRAGARGFVQELNMLLRASG